MDTTHKTQDLAGALRRAESVFRRKPQAALHDDAPATARWENGTRIVASHANGARIPTDMPQELGGSGDQISPGWLFRAGLASCGATVVAMTAAAEGIELTVLEVVARSRSDTRGLLGMDDDEGKPVCAGSQNLQLHVRVGARAIAPERLRALVTTGLNRSPVYAALQGTVPIAVQVEVAPS